MQQQQQVYVYVSLSLQHSNSQACITDHILINYENEERLFQLLLIKHM
jgi:hypothetical protein